jgi:hypothetical protein
MPDPVSSIGHLYVNQRNLTAENLVYVAGTDGNVSIGADREMGVQGQKGPLVQTEAGDVGVQQGVMQQQFADQYKPQASTGNQVADAAKKEFDYCNYAQGLYESKSDETFGLLGTLTPEQRARLKPMDEEIKKEVGKLNLPEAQAKEQIQLLRFRKMADEFKGTEVGQKSKEAYALGSYSRDTFNLTSARYGMPIPGQSNPYNPTGQVLNNYSQAVENPQMKKEMDRKKLLQTLCMIGMFSHMSMGFMPMLGGLWMR